MGGVLSYWTLIAGQRKSPARPRHVDTFHALYVMAHTVALTAIVGDYFHIASVMT
jgi:hypothetical protein